MADYFQGYVVWNKKRRSMVFADNGMDGTAFVWDHYDEAEKHCREGEADEVRRVRVELLPED